MNTASCMLPGPPLDGLSDPQLLAATRKLVGRSNQLLAALLAHLGEVEARGLHRTRACSSLYTYCIYELRLSEDEAYRRVAASRWVRRFPALLEAIASGELHLTGLLLLGPHLTDDNLVEVLGRAKYRTKKEVTGLVRLLNPLPDVPPRIEPLGPAPAPAIQGTPSWAVFMQSLCPVVRELKPGERPRDWVDLDEDGQVVNDGHGSKEVVGRGGQGASADVRSTEPPALEGPARVELPCQGEGSAEAAALQGSAPARVELDRPGEATMLQLPAPARVEPQRQGEGSAEAAALQGSAPARLEPRRYKVQFTASEEYVKLVEEAKALLSCRPQPGLAEIHFRALELLVATLKKQKYAVTSRPRKSPRTSSSPAAEVSAPIAASPAPVPASLGSASHEPTSRGATSRGAASPGLASKPARGLGPQLDRAKEPRFDRVRELKEEQGTPRQRGRHVPAAVRRAVFERDTGRCTYVSASGERCRETHGLELHHLDPYALGGEHGVGNITLRCRGHNALAAEEELGRDLFEQKRGSLGHERFAAQGLRE